MKVISHPCILVVVVVFTLSAPFTIGQSDNALLLSSPIVHGWVGSYPPICYRRFAGLYARQFPSGKETTVAELSGPIEDTTYSPDYRCIAFVEDGIYTVHPDGSHLTRLILPSKLKSPTMPAWSPDGSRMCIQDSNDGSLWVANVEDGACWQITQPGEHCYPFSWECDGNGILYVPWTGDSETGPIWRVSVDGKARRRVVEDPSCYELSCSPRRPQFLYATRLSGGWKKPWTNPSAFIKSLDTEPASSIDLGRARYPCCHYKWSHDGRRVCVSSVRKGATWPDAIQIVDIETGRRMAFRAKASDVVWSPDDRYIAYLHILNMHQTALRVLDLATSKAVAYVMQVEEIAW